MAIQLLCNPDELKGNPASVRRDLLLNGQPRWLDGGGCLQRRCKNTHEFECNLRLFPTFSIILISNQGRSRLIAQVHPREKGCSLFEAVWHPLNG